MEDVKVRRIADMLRRAATRQTVVSYQRLHSIFSAEQSLEYRYKTLEAAARSLSDPAILDYGCLMALANGLPGDDFFLRFKRLRAEDYEAVMGFASPGRSTRKKRVIALSERARVYSHAGRLFVSRDEQMLEPYSATDRATDNVHPRHMADRYALSPGIPLSVS